LVGKIAVTGRRRVTYHVIGIAVVVGVVSVLALVLHWQSRLGNRSPRAYEGLSAVLALAALAVALLAVLLAFPSFLAWTRIQLSCPNVTVGFELAPDTIHVPKPVEDVEE
jgi:hypothetical protein